MRRAFAVTTASLALLVSGCGGGDDDADAPSGGAGSGGDQSSAPAAGDDDDRAATLKVAIQGYTDALLKGELAGVVGYLDPATCDDDDEGSYALSIGEIKETAKGATMKIVSVDVQGDRGGTKDYELSKDAPDQLRRLVKAGLEDSVKRAWVYRNGEWYLFGPCLDESASPEPAAAS